MKKTLITGIVLILLIVGGVYLAAHRSSSPTAEGVATSTQPGSANTPSGTTVTIPEEGQVTLGLHETAAFKGVLITPAAVVEDSRCPAGVYCIQAGTVRVAIDINSALGTTTKTVKLGDSVTLGSQKFTFVSVDPLKTAKGVIKESDYRFTVKVEKLSTNAQ